MIRIFLTSPFILMRRKEDAFQKNIIKKFFSQVYFFIMRRKEDAFQKNVI